MIQAQPSHFLSSCGLNIMSIVNIVGIYPKRQADAIKKFPKFSTKKKQKNQKLKDR